MSSDLEGRHSTPDESVSVRVLVIGRAVIRIWEHDMLAVRGERAKRGWVRKLPPSVDTRR